ncbi:MAG: hypothetical protein F6K23_23065 [Okeania sp. SIO2C9]|nr:hypothetical protein [Okeania sp. SIO2C9]
MFNETTLVNGSANVLTGMRISINQIILMYVLTGMRISINQIILMYVLTGMRISINPIILTPVCR